MGQPGKKSWYSNDLNDPNDLSSLLMGLFTKWKAQVIWACDLMFKYKRLISLTLADMCPPSRESLTVLKCSMKCFMRSRGLVAIPTPRLPRVPCRMHWSECYPK